MLIRANRPEPVTITINKKKEQQNCRMLRCQYMHNPRWRYFIAIPKTNGYVAGNPGDELQTYQKEDLTAALKNLA